MYNEIDLEKSKIFLDNLQDFVIKLGLVSKKDSFNEFNGKKYDINTYYLLIDDEYNERGQETSKPRMKKIKEFNDGLIARYTNDKIEMLVIFFDNKIKLIFYCSPPRRKKVMDALLGFCEIRKP